jgi:hypothetical protein
MKLNPQDYVIRNSCDSTMTSKLVLKGATNPILDFFRRDSRLRLQIALLRYGLLRLQIVDFFVVDSRPRVHWAATAWVVAAMISVPCLTGIYSCCNGHDLLRPTTYLAAETGR